MQPDIVCMQETKLADSSFPLAFEALGYTAAHHGQGQWNGVAVLSRVGIDDVVAGFADGDPPDLDARLLSVTCAGIRISSVYVPNGRALDHEHYRYKLDWLARLRRHLGLPRARTSPSSWPATSTSPHRRRRVRRGEVRRPDAHEPARTSGAGRDRGLGSGGRLPPARVRAEVLLVVGLPRRRLPSGSGHADRSGPGVGTRGRGDPLVHHRSQRPQGPAVGPRPWSSTSTGPEGIAGSARLGQAGAAGSRRRSPVPPRARRGSAARAAAPSGARNPGRQPARRSWTGPRRRWRPVSGRRGRLSRPLGPLGPPDAATYRPCTTGSGRAGAGDRSSGRAAAQTGPRTPGRARPATASPRRRTR